MQFWLVPLPVLHGIEEGAIAIAVQGARCCKEHALVLPDSPILLRLGLCSLRRLNSGF